jgi:hypothetical protein
MRNLQHGLGEVAHDAIGRGANFSARERPDCTLRSRMLRNPQPNRSLGHHARLANRSAPDAGEENWLSVVVRHGDTSIFVRDN